MHARHRIQWNRITAFLGLAAVLWARLGARQLYVLGLFTAAAGVVVAIAIGNSDSNPSALHLQ